MALQIIIWVFIGIFTITAIITILGIVNAIQIRENYLNKLFYALIIEVVIAVVAVFKGVDFNQLENGNNLTELIQKAGVNKEFKNAREEANYLISQLQKSQEIPLLQEKLQSSEQEKSSLDKELEALRAELDSCGSNLSDFERTFYSKIVKLRSLIVEYSGSINLLYKPDEKKDVFRTLEDIFEILGTLENGDSGNIPALQQ